MLRLETPLINIFVRSSTILVIGSNYILSEASLIFDFYKSKCVVQNVKYFRLSTTVVLLSSIFLGNLKLKNILTKCYE